MTLDTPVVTSEDLLHSTLGGEEVILNPTNGTYYGLDGVGARVWTIIEEPHTAREVSEQLEKEYDVDRSTVERDVLELFREFDEEGLVETLEPPAA